MIVENVEAEHTSPATATAEEIKDAAGAVREVAHALLKALTPTPEQSADDQYPVPEVNQYLLSPIYPIG